MEERWHFQQCQINSTFTGTHGKMNLDLNLMLHTKDNSDLHVKCKTKKLLEKNRKHSWDLGSGEEVLHFTQKT